MITSYDQWLEEYRKDKYKIWLKATLSDATEVYMPEHKDWLKLKNHCEIKKLGITSVGLQYRSHSVSIDTSDSDGVYLIRSAIGTLGEVTKNTITIGKINGNKVHKTMWITPELIEEQKEVVDIDQCFEEAIILNYEEKARAI